MHIDTDEDYLSGFSAILMDDDFYNYSVKHSREIYSLQTLDKEALIVLKAKAYLNNRKRKKEGHQVHQEDIDKHKKDIYRLSYLFSGVERFEIEDSIKATLKDYLEAIQSDPISTKAIAGAMGLMEVPMQDFVLKIKEMFQLSDYHLSGIERGLFSGKI